MEEYKYMKKIDMTKGNVMNVLISLALPIMGSSILQFTYNLVDMLWVGSLGSNAVASIGSSSFFYGTWIFYKCISCYWNWY